MLGDPNALYCKSRGEGTSATLAHNVYVEPVSHQRAASFLCTAYSLTAIRWIQRLIWVNPSNAHNCFQRLSAHGSRYQQRPKANPLNTMETKVNTVHAISAGTVELRGGRITTVCSSSGDSVTLELPYGALSDAITKYLEEMTTRWDRDRFIKLLTDLNRAEDAKAEAAKA